MGADQKRLLRLPAAHDVDRSLLQIVEHAPQIRSICLAGLGDHQPRSDPVEKLHTQESFQRSDMPANPALSHADLFARAGEVEMLGRRFERHEGRERRQESGHDHDF